MAVKIRLSRVGTKNLPYYKVMIADERKSRDGKFIENVGTYRPLLKKDDPSRVMLKKDRIDYWLSVGAQPSERVVKFLNAGKIGQDKKAVKDKNEKLKQTIAVRKKNAEEAAKKAAAEAKAAEDKAKAEEAAKAAAAAPAAEQAAPSA